MGLIIFHRLPYCNNRPYKRQIFIIYFSNKHIYMSYIRPKRYRNLNSDKWMYFFVWQKTKSVSLVANADSVRLNTLQNVTHSLAWTLWMIYLCIQHHYFYKWKIIKMGFDEYLHRWNKKKVNHKLNSEFCRLRIGCECTLIQYM